MADKYAELRDSLEKNTRWINVTMDGKYSLFDIETIRALLAERDALREALQSIVDCCDEDHAARDYASRQTEIRGIARYALAQGEKHDNKS